MNNYLLTILTTLLLAVLKVVCLLIAIAYFTLAERKIMAAVQRRVGPNVVGPFGLLQPLADGLKLAGKELAIPAQASSRIFLTVAMSVLLFALSGWSVMPFGMFDHSQQLNTSTVVKILTLTEPKLVLDCVYDSSANSSSDQGGVGAANPTPEAGKPENKCPACGGPRIETTTCDAYERSRNPIDPFYDFVRADRFMILDAWLRWCGDMVTFHGPVELFSTPERELRALQNAVSTRDRMTLTVYTALAAADELPSTQSVPEDDDINYFCRKIDAALKERIAYLKTQVKEEED